MISLITDQHGTPVSIAVAGHTYTPDALIAALRDAQTLQKALQEASQETLREASEAITMYRDLWQEAVSEAQAQRNRADDAEQWVALLEAERKTERVR